LHVAARVKPGQLHDGPQSVFGSHG
jgi:hypothetical protein